MKRLFFLFAVSVFFFACSSESKKGNAEATDYDFRADFDTLSFPYHYTEYECDHLSFFKLIDYSVLSVFSFESPSKESYESDDYKSHFYALGQFAMPLINKDAYLVAEFGNPSLVGNSCAIFMIVLDKSGEITDKIILSECCTETEENSSGTFVIKNVNEQIEITKTVVGKEKQNFTINQDGEIETLSYNENQQKLNQLLEKLSTLNIPLKYNEKINSTELTKIDIQEYSFLNQNNIFGEDFSNIVCTGAAKLPEFNGNNIIILHTWDETMEMSDDISLYSVSSSGVVNAKIGIFSGEYAQDYYTIFTSNNIFYRIETVYIKNGSTMIPEITQTVYEIGEEGNLIEGEIITYYDRMLNELKFDEVEHEKLSVIRKHFYDIKQSKHIADFIDNDVWRLRQTIQAGIDNNMPNLENPNKLDYLSDLFPGLVIGYGAEGSGIEVYYNYYELSEKAKLTPETDDEAFFKAFSNGVEPEEDYNTKRMFLYEYGAYMCSDMETCFTLLGPDVEKLLTLIDDELSKQNNFTKLLIELKSKFLIQISDSKYAFSKEVSLKAINYILKTIGLSNSDREQLETVKSDIENASEDAFNYIGK